MTTEISQMLDELMGKNRNAAPDDKSNDMHWSDKDVCKNFLCGFCPAELFTNTRSDLGPCEKIHDEAMRKAYQQSSRYMKMNYESEFLHYLQQCMQDVERRIRRNHQRLQLSEEKNQKLLNPSKDVEDQINILTQRIEEKLQKIEQLGNEGNVEEAQGVMKLCDQLKEDREQLYGQKGNVLDAFSVQEKQMEVCEVCGAFLIVGDAQSRVDDHLMGKQHMGYAKIKAHIEELKEKLRNKPEPQKAPEEPNAKRSRMSLDSEKRRDKRSRSHQKDDRQTKRRSRSRDSKRERDRDHERKRSRDRDRDRRSKDYDRRRSRDRDSRRSHSDRSRDSGRRRSRDRDSGRLSNYHSRDRSRDDKDRKSSRRSRSRDREHRHSRKHSRPRSQGKDRRDHKHSRRSDSHDEKSERSRDKDKQQKESQASVGDKKDSPSKKTTEDTENKEKECQVSENNNDGDKAGTTEEPVTTDYTHAADEVAENGHEESTEISGEPEMPPGTEGDE